MTSVAGVPTAAGPAPERHELVWTVAVAAVAWLLFSTTSVLRPVRWFVTLVRGAGLVIERLRELDETWDPIGRQNLVRDPRTGLYAFPPGTPSLPLVYTLTARRPPA